MSGVCAFPGGEDREITEQCKAARASVDLFCAAMNMPRVYTSEQMSAVEVAYRPLIMVLAKMVGEMERLHEEIENMKGQLLP